MKKQVKLWREWLEAEDLANKEHKVEHLEQIGRQIICLLFVSFCIGFIHKRCSDKRLVATI